MPEGSILRLEASLCVSPLISDSSIASLSGGGKDAIMGERQRTKSSSKRVLTSSLPDQVGAGVAETKVVAQPFGVSWSMALCG